MIYVLILVPCVCVVSSNDLCTHAVTGSLVPCVCVVSSNDLCTHTVTESLVPCVCVVSSHHHHIVSSNRLLPSLSAFSSCIIEL